jgi:hypothetical protein
MGGYSTANGGSLANTVSTFSGGINDRINLAGRVNFNLASGIQAIGEVGRIGNVLPPLESALLGFSPIAIRAPAFYGEGGVRAAFGGSRSAVAPYVEATGGFARVRVHVGDSNNVAEDLLQLGLNLTSQTSPMAGLGAGITWHAGPLSFDTGYRYKKIFATDIATTLLSGGQQQLTTQSVVFGAGIRF